MKNRSRTKIVCTIGPKTASKSSIKRLISNGMSVARINFSHGDYDALGQILDNVKCAREESNCFVAIAMDTKGPEIRTIINKGLRVKRGDQVVFACNSTPNDPPLEINRLPSILMNIDSVDFLAVGDEFFIDDTRLRLRVNHLESRCFVAEALNEYLVEPNKRISFPNNSFSKVFLRDVDRADIAFALEKGADAIFLSFVEHPREIDEVRELIGDDSIQIIAKIETSLGVENIEKIAQAADGIMIARGDLATDVGIENLFATQKTLTAKCISKPKIMATELMLSMTENTIPTRAEVSDVGNAVLDGCDCVMLSSETATGKHPFLTTNIMRKICLNAESLLFQDKDEKSSSVLQENASLLEKRKFSFLRGRYFTQRQ